MEELRLQPSPVQIISFSCYMLPPLHCPALFPASASSLSLDCPLTLWLIPDSSVSCGQAGGFCCFLLLLFTQMNFSQFPTRACEWVAWAFVLFCFLSPWIKMGFGCLAELEK